VAIFGIAADAVVKIGCKHADTVVDSPRLSRLLYATRSYGALFAAACKLCDVAADDLARHMVRISTGVMEPAEEMREPDGIGPLRVDGTVALALSACFKEDWSNGNGKAKRILLPVRHLQQWIEHNVLLILKDAPFDKRNAELVPEAGSCVGCPKRTGHNKLLFADVLQDACTDPTCYHKKIDAHVAKTVATKPKLVQISTAYGQQPEGSATLPRNKYTEIRAEKPKSKEEAARPEYKTCKHTNDAIVTEGMEKGEIRRVCTYADCPVHHPQKQRQPVDVKWKADQEKRRREEALAQATGGRTLAAISAAVPVRLMKRDLLFIVEHLSALLDERRLEIIARQRGIKKAKDNESTAKLVRALIRKADEGELRRLLVEMVLLQSARSQTDAGVVLKEAAEHYKVDTEAIATKVKQEFAAKEKATAPKHAAAKQKTKPAKKPAAA
jgi:ParB family transcriptional regulator, chromosome partitioning protein